MTPTKLYRHFSKDGVLLYVGVSSQLGKRQAQHLSRSRWADLISRIEIETYPTRAAAIAAEQEIIAAEHPVYNTYHSNLTKYRSAKSKIVSVRMPEALLRAIDCAASEDRVSRSALVTSFLEATLLARGE